MSIKNKAVRYADSLGMKHMGVTAEEYGDRLSYRLHTIFSIGAESVKRALGMDTKFSQSNLEKATEIRKGII